VAGRLAAAAPGDVVLCSVVVAELLYGAQHSSQISKNLAQVRAFAGQFVSLPFDDVAAEDYGQIRAKLSSQGMLIGPNDLLIASIARANQLILVTHNTAEFARVPKLALEDWQAP
jgi:tRNA(fMet)-specific endonuclease VapC